MLMFTSSYSSIVLLHVSIACLPSLLNSCLAQMPGPPPSMPRSQTYQGRDTDGTYSFGYTVHEPSGTTKFRQESGDGAGNRQGSYGLEEKDSQRIVFNYATKPKSSTQFINHPVPLTTTHINDQSPPMLPSSLTSSSSSASASASGQGPMDQGSVDVGFQPSFEPRGQEMGDDEGRYNSPSFDEEFDFEGQKFGGPRMRQTSNTHWDGGESGGGQAGAGPWNKSPVNGASGGSSGESNGHQHHHHHHHHQHSPSPHQHNSELDHQRGEEYGINESNQEMTNEPGNYDRLVAYLANQSRPNGPPLPPPPPPPHPRGPMRPEEFPYKSR